MSVSITTAKVDSTGTMVALRCTDNTGARAGITALDLATPGQITVTIDGTSTNYPVSTTNPLVGINDGNLQQMYVTWCVALVRLTAMVTSASQVVTVTVTAGWATTTAGALPAQSAIPCANEFGTTQGLLPPAPVAPQTMLLNENIQYPCPSDWQLTFGLRNMCKGTEGWGSPPGANLNGFGYPIALGSGGVLTCTLLGQQPDPPGSSHTQGYLNLPSSGVLSVLSTVAAGDASNGGVPFVISTDYTGTVTPYQQSTWVTTGANRRAYYSFQAAVGYNSCSIYLNCYTVTATMCNVFRQLTANYPGRPDNDPDGLMKWDPFYLQQLQGRHAIRLADGDSPNDPTARCDQTDEPIPANFSQLSENRYGINSVRNYIGVVDNYPDPDNFFDPNTYYTPISCTSVDANGNPVTHGLRDYQFVKLETLASFMPNGGAMDVYRPQPGDGFFNALSFAGSGSGATTCLVDCGTSSALNFAGAFTVEFKFALATASIPGLMMMVTQWDDTSTQSRFQVFLNSDNTLQGYVMQTGGGSNYVAFSTNFTPNTNKHDFAMACDGANLTAWLDGAVIFHGACTGMRSDSSGSVPLVLGARSDGGGIDPFAGFLDEVRISTVGRYPQNSAYTPSTKPFPSDGHTAALYHLDSAPTTTAVVDSTLAQYVGILEGTAPGSLVASPLAGFGQCLSLPGTAGNFVNFSTPPALNFNGPFTIDFRIQLKSLTFNATQEILGQYDGSTDNRFRIFMDSNGGLDVWIWTTGNVLQGFTVYQFRDLSMHAVRFACDGNNAVVFVDGIQQGTGQSCSGMRSDALKTVQLSLGAMPDGTNPLAALIDELVISTISRVGQINDYRGPVVSYTPSTAPEVVDASTILLCHFDTTLATAPAPPATTTPDSGPNGLAGTLQGATLPSIVTSPLTGFDNAMSFPGTGTGPTTSLITFGTPAALNFSGAFTVDFRIKLNSLTFLAEQDIIGQFSGGGPQDRFRIFIDTTGAMNVWIYLTGGSLQGATTYPFADTAVHTVRFACDGTNQAYWVDGIQIGTSQACTGMRSDSNGSVPLVLGAMSGANPLNAVIDEVEISNVARSTIPAVGTGTISYTPSAAPENPDSNTVLLCHLDILGAQTAPPPTVFTVVDSGPNALTGTLEGATLPELVASPLGAAFTNALQFPGTGSGTSTSLVNFGAPAILNFSGAFTVDFRIQMASLTNLVSQATCVAQDDGTIKRFWIFVDSNGNVDAWIYQTGDNVVGIGGPGFSDLNAHAMRFSCDGTLAAFWMDGQMFGGTTTCTGLPTDTAPVDFTIGGMAQGNALTATIDEVIFSNTFRGSFANYTVPTTPATADANTMVLCHFDVINAGSRAASAAPGPRAGTPAGLTLDSGPNELTGTLQGATLPSLVVSPWYVPALTGHSVVNQTGLGDPTTIFCKAIDAYTFAIGMRPSGSVVCQRGDYAFIPGAPLTMPLGSSSGGGPTYYWSTGVGLSTQDKIDLCNQLNAHMYINFPGGGTDAYAQWIANAVKSGVSGGQPLNSNLNLYVSYINETWNFSFLSSFIPIAQGIQLGTNQPSLGFTLGDPYQTGDQFTTHRLGQLYDLMNPIIPGRVKINVEFQGSNTTNMVYRLDWAANHGFLQKIAYTSGAPYLNMGPMDNNYAPIYDAMSIAQIMSVAQAWVADNPWITLLKTNFDRLYTGSSSYQAMYGYAPEHITYEGGLQNCGFVTDLTGPGTGDNLSANRSRAVFRDPQIYAIVQCYHQSMAPYITQFTHFNFSQTPGTPYGGAPATEMWGLYHGCLQNAGRGTGVAPSTFNNRSDPDNLAQIEAVVAQAMIDWQAMTTAVAATSFTISGPATGPVNAASMPFTFTVNGTYSGGVLTPTMTGLAGSWTPATLSFASGASQTATYSATAAGTGTANATSSPSLTAPSSVSYAASTAAATSFTVSGPATGIVGSASTPFTFTVNGTYATGVLTPTMTGLAGSWTPATLSFASVSSATATFNATAAGTGTANATSSPSLTAPASVSYAASAAAATSFTVSGPATGTVGTASGPFTYTVNGTYTSGVLTPTMSGLAGTWNPATLPFSSGLTQQSAFTASASGVGTASATAVPALSLPIGVSYTAALAAATSFTISGPSTGAVGSASTPFTFTVNGTYTSGVLTPTMTGLAGAWNPSTISFASGMIQTATYNATAAGTGSANATSSPSLQAPASHSYTASVITAHPVPVPILMLATSTLSGV